MLGAALMGLRDRSPGALVGVPETVSLRPLHGCRPGSQRGPGRPVTRSWQVPRRALIGRAGAQGDEDGEPVKPVPRGTHRDGEWRPGGREELGRRAAAAAGSARLQRARSDSPESSDAEEQVLRMARCRPRPCVLPQANHLFALACKVTLSPPAMQPWCS